MRLYSGRYLALFFSLSLVAPQLASAQLPVRDPSTGKYSYQEVVHVDSTTATTLFQRAVNWFEREFKVSQLNLTNAAEGTLAHAGSFAVTWKVKDRGSELRITYTAAVECRDGRYRYTFTDYKVSTPGIAQHQTLEAYCDYAPAKGKKSMKAIQEQILVQVQAHTLKCISDLRTIISVEQLPRDKW